MRDPPDVAVSCGCCTAGLLGCFGTKLHWLTDAAGNMHDVRTTEAKTSTDARAPFQFGALMRVVAIALQCERRTMTKRCLGPNWLAGNDFLSSRRPLDRQILRDCDFFDVCLRIGDRLPNLVANVAHVVIVAPVAHSDFVLARRRKSGSREVPGKCATQVVASV